MRLPPTSVAARGAALLLALALHGAEAQSQTRPPATKLWIAATRLVAEVPSTDVDPDDEAYVVIAVADLTDPKPGFSYARALVSPIQPGIKRGDARALDLRVWGVVGPTAEPRPIFTPQSAVILAAAMEKDCDCFGDDAARALEARLGEVFLQVLNGRPKGGNRAALVERLTAAMAGQIEAATSRLGADGDDFLAAEKVKELPLSREDLTSARSGQVVRKALEFQVAAGARGGPARYQVHLQLGKEGTSLLSSPGSP